MKAWEKAEISELDVNATADVQVTKNEWGTWNNSGYGWYLVERAGQAS